MLPHWIISLDGGPKRVNHTAVLIEHKIYMFGGYCSSVNYEQSIPIDIHVLNTYNNRWMKIFLNVMINEDITQVPFMRYGHASVAVGNLAYLWGGRNDSLGACNKLFSFDTKILKWKRHKVNGVIPEARDGHAMCLCQGNIYLFGGFEEQENRFSNDLFILELPDHTWSRIVYKNYLAASWRDFHTISALGNNLYVFGGRGDWAGPIFTQNEVYDNNLKAFNLDTSLWFDPVEELSEKPLGRRSHSAFTFNNCLYIFGGFNARPYRHFNDLWKFDPAERKWFPVLTSGLPPCPRRRQTCCVHEGKVFLFGGSSPNSTALSYQESLEEVNLVLLDHGDLHVLDLCPSLQTLCLTFAIKHDLDLSSLPHHIRCRAHVMSVSQPIIEFNSPQPAAGEDEPVLSHDLPQSL